MLLCTASASAICGRVSETSSKKNCFNNLSFLMLHTCGACYKIKGQYMQHCADTACAICVQKKTVITFLSFVVPDIHQEYGP